MSCKTKKNEGFSLIELAVGLSILSLILIILAMSLDGFRRFNHYQLVRQRCICAAQAELDSIAVTGAVIGDDDFARLWPGLDVAIEQSEGIGQWRGLKLIKVKTCAKSLNKNIRVELSRYILPKQEN